MVWHELSKKCNCKTWDDKLSSMEISNEFLMQKINKIVEKSA